MAFLALGEQGDLVLSFGQTMDPEVTGIVGQKVDDGQAEQPVENFFDLFCIGAGVQWFGDLPAGGVAHHLQFPALAADDEAVNLIGGKVGQAAVAEIGLIAKGGAEDVVADQIDIARFAAAHIEPVLIGSVLAQEERGVAAAFEGDFALGFAQAVVVPAVVVLEFPPGDAVEKAEAGSGGENLPDQGGSSPVLELALDLPAIAAAFEDQFLVPGGDPDQADLRGIEIEDLPAADGRVVLAGVLGQRFVDRQENDGRQGQHAQKDGRNPAHARRRHHAITPKRAVTPGITIKL